MAKRIGDDLAILIAGYRGKIKRSNDRAEPLVLSPKLFSEFLDKVESQLTGTREALLDSLAETSEKHADTGKPVFRVTESK